MTEPHEIQPLQQSTAPLPVPVTWATPMPLPAPEQILTQIGDVAITRSAALTPHTRIPLRGSAWIVQDAWTVTQKTPTWAVVLAIVGFFCLTFFSLLFLLAKETVYTGMVQITVSNGPQHHVTRIPVASQIQVHQIHQQVNWIRTLTV